MNSTKSSFDDQFEAAEREVRRLQSARRIGAKFSFSTASTSKPRACTITMAVAQAMMSSTVDLSALPNKRSCK